MLEILDQSATCTRVLPNQARPCLDETYDDLFSPSFWGMLFGAETLHVVVITATRTVRFTTNPNTDWVFSADGLYQAHGLRNKHAPFGDDVWTEEEGGVSAEWVHQEDGVAGFALRGDRIGVLTGKRLYVKERLLTSGFVHQENEVEQFALDGDRIGVLLSGGKAKVKEPELKSKWKGEGDGVSALQVKAGKLTDGWVHQADGVQRFQLDRGRIGVLIDGTLQVKESGLSGKWDEERTGVSAFQLHGNWIGALVGGTLYVKKGSLGADWTAVEQEVDDFQIQGERIAVRSGGQVKVKDGDVNSKWSLLRSNVAAWQLTSTRLGILTTDGVFSVQEGDVYYGYHNWRA
jgi:hypothetical protein